MNIENLIAVPITLPGQFFKELKGKEVIAIGTRTKTVAHFNELRASLASEVAVPLNISYSVEAAAMGNLSIEELGKEIEQAAILLLNAGEI